MDPSAEVTTSSSFAPGKLPPGPRGRPLVGVLPELFGNLLAFFSRCSREYGDVVYFRIGRTPVCLLNHPDDIETVLVQNPFHFHKSRDYRALARIMGSGLLTSEGELWRRQRRLMQPAFHQPRIAGYAEIMTRFGERMASEWRDGETRDIHRDMMRLTLEIIAKTLFDAEIQHETGGIGEAMEVFMREFVGLAKISFVLPAWMPLPSSRRLSRASRHLDEIVYRLIRERQAGKDRPGDLLDMLIQARDADGQAMSNRQVRDEVTTLFLAGHETTALALTYTWYLLGKHPAVQDRLAKEVTEVLDGRTPKPADTAKLQFAEMVILESMRLYPPAWGIGRQARVPFAIRDYQFAAGTNVFICQWLLHRDARYFPEPQKFNPERWREDPIRSGRLPRFAYFPFGGGPRTCIGSSFAMMEAVLLLSTIVQRYRMEIVGDGCLELLPTVTLRPKHGVRMRLTKR